MALNRWGCGSLLRAPFFARDLQFYADKALTPPVMEASKFRGVAVVTADRDGSFLDLVRRAQGHDRAAVEALAGRVRPRVFAFIRRLLVDVHTAEDLAQDTALAVIASIGELRRPERFWAWVFSIACSKVRQHFRRTSRRGVFLMADGFEAKVLQVGGDAFTHASQQELAELTRQAMSELEMRHRMVLALRVFEDLSHAEVARILGCSELSARVTFFHAKRALKRRLRKLGVDEGVFAAALTAFGVGTLAGDVSAATVTVSMSALTEGVVAGLLSAKVKVACLALMLLGGWASWGLLRGPAPSSFERRDSLVPPAMTDRARELLSSDQKEIFIRYTAPWEIPGAGVDPNRTYKHWYYLPEGPEGPVLYRVEEWDCARDRLVRYVIQNEQAKYEVDPAIGRVTVFNYGVPHGPCRPPRVPTLPTDPAGMCALLRGREGPTAIAMADGADRSFQRDPVTGWVKTSLDWFPGERDPWTTRYDYHPFDLEVLKVPESNRYVWVDRRDDRYRRGWGFVRVEGELHGFRPLVDAG